jgi:AcrR family transcriptional regulator
MSAVPAATAEGRDQQANILAVALDLMANNGVAGMSMRQLATACGLNVATLYHYFPSKADLLRAVIADRNYQQMMQEVSIPVDRRLSPRRRLTQLLTSVWRETLAERPVWRLLIGESLRGDTDAIDVVSELGSALEAAVDRWLAESFPELPADHSAVTSVVTSQLLSFFLEDLLLPESRRHNRFEQRAAATAAVVFPA